MPSVLDTHAWVWWVTNDRRLSSRGRSAIERAAKRGELYLSIYSIWEMAKPSAFFFSDSAFSVFAFSSAIGPSGL